MNTETTTEQSTKNSKNVPSRTWWIEFREDTGKIVKISSRPIEPSIKPGILQTTSQNPICKELQKGSKTSKRYAMTWDMVNDKWELDKKATTLNIIGMGDKLSQFKKNTHPTTNEIYAKVFYNTNKIMVSANLDNIRKNKNLADIHQISVDEDNMLDIFITRKNDPDYLIGVIDVDSKTLMKTSRLVVDLSDDIVAKVDWANTSFYTKPVFTHYGFELTDQTLESNIVGQKRTIQVSSKKYNDKICNINIVVYNKDKFMHLTSSITEEQLYYFNDRPSFNFFVCDETPDKPITEYSLSVEQVLANDIKIPIEQTWPANPLIIFKNEYFKLYARTETQE